MTIQSIVLFSPMIIFLYFSSQIAGLKLPFTYGFSKLELVQNNNFVEMYENSAGETLIR